MGLDNKQKTFNMENNSQQETWQNKALNDMTPARDPKQSVQYIRHRAAEHQWSGCEEF